jgi:hypothetical protein
MMRSKRSKWISGIGAVVLSGGLLVAGYGTGAPPAEATITLVNPFPIIIDKLNQILAKLNTSSGGGGNHTLRWDTNNPSATRFTTAFPGAVLDNNTGLVWEQAPDVTPRSWEGARRHCVNRRVGETVGWRLPSVVELKSLQDLTLPEPFVPGTVFTGVQTVNYWSATKDAGNPTLAWNVSFVAGDSGGIIPSGLVRPIPTFDINIYPVWCVRGGMHADQY